MGRLRRYYRPGYVIPVYPTEWRPPYDVNPQKGMEGAALNRSGQPVSPAAANKLAAQIEKERAERIAKQGHA
jgi:hypothetical protein